MCVKRKRSEYMRTTIVKPIMSSDERHIKRTVLLWQNRKQGYMCNVLVSCLGHK